MNYIELKIKGLPAIDETEILIAQLASIGFESFTEESDALLAYIPEKYFQRENLSGIQGLKDLDEKEQIEINFIKDQNWNTVWESNYHPVSIGGRCFVRAPFHQSDPTAEFDILLKPKMAFGTAHHETTALMIEKLLDIDMTGKKVLDMGCGTGVLAILAKMKGAAEVTAIDNDEWAFSNARENTELNSIKGIEILLGDAQLLEKDAYDLVLANINKNILLSDMTAYSEALKPQAFIYFSGFYTEDLDDIKAEANKRGLIFVSHDSKNKWAIACFKKQ